MANAQRFDPNPENWEPGVSSGYAGMRHKQTGSWIYLDIYHQLMQQQKQDDPVDRLIQALESQKYTVKIQRLSETSYAPDCQGVKKILGLSEKERLPGVPLKSVGNCWRCQIGRDSQWHYGRTIWDAIESAVGGGSQEEREAALAKLTPHERKLLGIK